MQMGRIAIEPTQIGRIDSANRPFRHIRRIHPNKADAYSGCSLISAARWSADLPWFMPHKRSGQNIVNGLSEVLQGFLNLCAADDGGSMPPAADIRNGKRPAYQDYEATEPDRGTVRPEWRRDLENSRNKYRRNRELFFSGSHIMI